jgi:hypothetical protein
VPALFAWTWIAILAGMVVAAIGGSVGVEAPTPPDDGMPSPAGRRARLAQRPDPVLALGLAVALLVPTALEVPDRLRGVDRSRDLAARRWVDRALELMAPDAVIVSWWSFSTPLWYAQHVEGRRPDLTIIDDRTRLDQELGEIYDVIDANLPDRPVYVIRIDRSEIQALDDRYALDFLDGRDAGTLTRVIGRRGAGSAP